MQVKALIAATLFCLLPSAGHATNLMYMPFETVLSDALRAGRLDGSVKFYLVGNGPLGTQQLLRRGVVSDLSTNGFNKSDQFSCEWVLQSNLIKLQAEAKRVGASGDFCHAGSVEGGFGAVALKGRSKDRSLRQLLHLECLSL